MTNQHPFGHHLALPHYWLKWLVGSANPILIMGNAHHAYMINIPGKHHRPGAGGVYGRAGRPGEINPTVAGQPWLGGRRTVMCGNSA